MPKIVDKKKIAFVASGGAVKAACFHTGVALALQRRGFTFKGGLKTKLKDKEKHQIQIYVGSSAGAFFTAGIASGFSPDDIYYAFENPQSSRFTRVSYLDIFSPDFSDIFGFYRRFRKSSKVKRMSIERVLQQIFGINGFFTIDNLERYLRKNILPSNDFKKLAPELYIIATELDNPKRVVFGPKKLKESSDTTYLSNIEISKAVAASMSLPLMFKPYKIRLNGKETYLFDGEIRETLSVDIAEDAGADLIIVSYTHQPYHKTEKFGSLADYGLFGIIIQAIYQIVEQKIANYKEIFELKKNVLLTIEEFCWHKNISSKVAEELIDAVEKVMNYQRNIDYIFIRPSSIDADMFFEDHFNLSQESMGHIIRKGYKRAGEILNRYEFS